MTSKQLPYKFHQQSTLYDWAKSESWSELRYDADEMVWRGFAPGSYIEEDVPIEVIFQFLPLNYKIELEAVALHRLQHEKQVLKLLQDKGLRWQTKNVDAVSELMNCHGEVFYDLAKARQEYDLKVKYAAYAVALILACD
jgi:hypothetical protein